MLLINTVGKVLGLQTNKLDSMLINAARYTAQQFVGRIREHLPDADLQEMQEENLLTYEQFRKVFERHNPQVSLLFDTGAGYFAFCVIAPHLLQNGVGTAISMDNAISEIEEYLTQREASKAEEQPKILIVDDSMTIRQGMKQLLEEDLPWPHPESPRYAPSLWTGRIWFCWITRCRSATASRYWR